MKNTGLMALAAIIAFTFLSVACATFSSEVAEKNVIMVQTFKNLEVRSYHTMMRLDKLLAPKIEEKLMALNGVTEVRAAKSSDLFEIKIRKGLVFKWEEIEPAILNCIAMLCYNGQTPNIRRVEAKY